MRMNDHDRFLRYLESTKYFKRSKSEELIAFAEEKLPEFLHANGYPNVTDIYNHLDTAFWNGIVTDGLPAQTEDDRRYASMVKNSIRFIKGFIDYNSANDSKKLLNKKIKEERQQPQQSICTSSVDADPALPEDETQPRREGTVSQVCVTHYERNSEDRKKVLERDHYECQVCHIKFVDLYGDIGKDYIEVHHLYPVCNMGENYQFDPLDPEKGLVCLCSNCHSMIHRGGHFEEIDGQRKMVPMTLKELQKRYNERNKNR